MGFPGWGSTFSKAGRKTGLEIPPWTQKRERERERERESNFSDPSNVCNETDRKRDFAKGWMIFHVEVSWKEHSDLKYLGGLLYSIKKEGKRRKSSSLNFPLTNLQKIGVPDDFFPFSLVERNFLFFAPRGVDGREKKQTFRAKSFHWRERGKSLCAGFIVTWTFFINAPDIFGLHAPPYKSIVFVFFLHFQVRPVFVSSQPSVVPRSL